MANSIAGNAGLANATVYINGVSAAVVTADGSGNYTFSGLAAGTYYVFPQVAGHTFTPRTSVQTIVSTNITNVNFTAANAITPTVTWIKQGPVIPSTTRSGSGALEGTVIYEANAQILSGTVYKMWYTYWPSGGGTQIRYAESTDGITWSQYSGNPVISTYTAGRVVHVGATYYFYGSPGGGGDTSIDLFTSTDGVTWGTVAHTAVISEGAAGTWDAAEIWGLQVFEVTGGTWYAVYNGIPAVTNNGAGHTGLATSTDGITWTKSPSNPVILNFSSTYVIKVGSTYYAYGDIVIQGQSGKLPFEFPTDFGRCSSTDRINWTDPVLSITRVADWEGPTGNGQLDTPCVLQTPAGKTYMWYGAGFDLSTGTSFVQALAISQKVLADQVVVPVEGGEFTQAELVQVKNYNFATVENPLSNSSNFTICADTTYTGTMKVIAGNLCEATAIGVNTLAIWTGAILAPSNAWPADHYSELTLHSWTAASSIATIEVRHGAFNSGTGYLLFLNANNGYALYGIVGNTAHILINTTAQTIAALDVWRLAVVGNVLTIMRNNVVITTFTDTNNYIASGTPGFGVRGSTLITDTQTNLWAAGATQQGAPTFSPIPGPFSGTLTVTITGGAGATIYYTTDGTTPNESSSSIASGATISLTASHTVNAISSKANFVDSVVASSTYTLSSSGNAGSARLRRKKRIYAIS